MHKGFYMYLAMAVTVALLLGAELKGRIDGDRSFSIFDICMSLLWCAAAIYLVIDEYKLKESYTVAEKEGV